MAPRIAALLLCLAIPGVAAAQGPVPAPLAHPTADDLATGARVFASSCSRCHGLDGTGGAGPPLARPRLRRADDEAGIIGILENGVPGTAMQPAFLLSEAQIVRVAAYVRSLGQRPEEALPGDPARGRAIYVRAACAACHIMNGEGTGTGPELSDIGTLRGASFLRQSIVEPAAAHPVRAVPYEPYAYPGYIVVHATPRDGAEITGLCLNEDAFTIQIRDQQGRLHSLRKADLVRLVADSGTSLMPSFRDTLKAAELDDLVAYLTTRRGTR